MAEPQWRGCPTLAPAGQCPPSQQPRTHSETRLTTDQPGCLDPAWLGRGCCTWLPVLEHAGHPRAWVPTCYMTSRCPRHFGEQWHPTSDV